MVHLKKWLSHLTDCFCPLYADSSEQRLSQCESYKGRSQCSPFRVHVKATFIKAILNKELKMNCRVFIVLPISSHLTEQKVNSSWTTPIFINLISYTVNLIVLLLCSKLFSMQSVPGGAHRQHCPLKTSSTSSYEESSNFILSRIYGEWQGKRWCDFNDE